MTLHDQPAVDVHYLPEVVENQVRLLAAELLPRRSSVRLREVRAAAGRLAERLQLEGGERWQAVKLEDHFARAVHDRLRELDQLAADVSIITNIVPLPRKETAA